MGSLVHRYRTLFAALLIVGSANVGLVFQSATRVEWPWAAFLLLFPSLALPLVWFYFGGLRRTYLFSAIAAVLLIQFGWWLGWTYRDPSPDGLALSASRRSQPIAVRGTIAGAATWMPNPNYRFSNPSSQPWRTRWDVVVKAVREGENWRDVYVRTRLGVDGRLDNLLPGDEFECYGAFRQIYAPTNPGEFDLAAFHRRYGRFVTISADDEEQVRRTGLNPYYLASRLRAMAVRSIDRRLQSYVAFDQSPLAAALVFGQREQVDWQDQQQLMATGTIHMLAISGMHVEIVAAGVLMLCAICGLSDRQRFVAVVTVCILYAALAGGKAPVLRATILIAAYEVSRLAGRKARVVNLLGAAALILFALRTTCFESAGVQLSFLAVLAIAVFAGDRDSTVQDEKERLKLHVHENRSGLQRWWFGFWTNLWQMVRLSFWVWLVTCPLVWMHFNVLSPIAIPLNVLLSVPLTISLMAGLGIGIAGFIPGVASLFGLLCGTGLWMITTLVGWASQIPGGHVWLPTPPMWWTVGFYSCIAFWGCIFGFRRRRTLGCILLVWVGFGVWLCISGAGGLLDGDAVSRELIAERASASGVKHANSGRENEQAERFLRMTFLDVGHGTCAIIELPDGSTWLYDAGQLGTPERSHQEIAAALWHLGKTRIDRLIISHADVDHYNAVSGLMDRFRINEIVSTSHFWASADDDVAGIVQKVDDQRIARATWTAGQRGNAEGVQWSVLHPSEGHRFESDNAASLCLQFEFAGQRILLPGDLEGSGLRTLAQLPARPCQVLMAPHHGSLAVDVVPLLEWCRPNAVIVSGNHRADQEQVHQRFGRQGATVGVTFRHGAIQFGVCENGSHYLAHWKDSHWQLFP